VETLTKHVTDHIQQYTQTGGARPFGVALLVGGVENDGTPRLYETDPSGTPYEWKAVAIGGNREDIQRRLEDDYDEALTLGDGVDLALESLAEATEDGFPEEGIAVSTVPTESGELEALSTEEIGERLAALDLLKEGEDE